VYNNLDHIRIGNETMEYVIIKSGTAKSVKCSGDTIYIFIYYDKKNCHGKQIITITE